MGPVDRDAPRESDHLLRHQHSASSDHSRSLIPMWDSSDPERAPPPLPLNPQSPSMTSRAGTSHAIQTAHAALTEKARESALVSNALARRIPEMSPEKPSPKTAAHRRMQSLQTSSVRDLSLMLEGGQQSIAMKPTERQQRPSTPVRGRDDKDSRSPEKDGRSSVTTPTPGPSLTPIVRPSVRRPQHSILGENTPPQSATMLALQNMAPPAPRDTDMALANVTNGSTALIKAPQSVESLSGQILSLTNIATCLQKDIAQLSRRSRDNATDLLSLKEATNARDEDIRKSLRDLVHNISDPAAQPTPRDPFATGLLLDNKPHHTSSPSTSKAVRPFSLPRIPSPNSFAASIDMESRGSSSLHGSDGATTVALLEKIIREMSTKSSQEVLIAQLSDVADKIRGIASANKLDELIDVIRGDQAVVPLSGGGGMGNTRPRIYSFGDEPTMRELEHDSARPGPMTRRVERLLADKEGRRSSTNPSRGAELLNDDVLKIIRTVKDSVAQGGGLTAEVKALVRELRGEVLGMGREIGRRLDEIVAKNKQKGGEPTKEEIGRIIDEGLGQMKDHMDNLLREHRRQSAASASSRTSVVDYQEIYNAMRAALKDSQASTPRASDLNREDVIEAVREAWENYKPEIQIEQVGLERDEVLSCLKEGLRDYAPRDPRHVGASREDVLKAIVEGFKHFVPPSVETPATLSRDEILDAVRECLEEFEFPVAPSAMNGDLTRDDMVHAVREGLREFDPSRSTTLAPGHGGDEEVLARLREILKFMQAEFRAVSEEAKENVAANGRDTEQLLDATKDGLEKLRCDIEAYVDRAAGSVGRGSLTDGILESLDGFRGELVGLVTQASEASQEALQAQIETVREAVNSAIVPIAPNLSHKEILEALRDGLDSIRVEVHRPGAATGQILDALQEGFAELRSSLDKIAHRPADLTANDEILDALKAGMDSVRSDIDNLRGQGRNDRAVATVEDGAVIAADVLKTDDIKNLEVLITQLRIKVEAMEPVMESVTKEDLSRMENVLKHVQETVESIPGHASEAAPGPEGAASREDVQAIETILRNTKARLDDLIDGEQAVRKEHIDALESLILETRESLTLVSAQLDGVSKRDDVTMLESLVSQVAAGFDEMKDRADKELENPEKISKTDLEAVEALCLDVKTVLDQVVQADIPNLPNKADIEKLEGLVTGLRDRMDSQADASSKAVEGRQAEIVGVSDKITELKVFLGDFSTLVKSKLEDGATGIDAMGKLLENLTDTMSKNANVGQDVREMFEIMKAEFEESRAGVVGAKIDADEKFQQTTDTLAEKFDERINELIAKYEEFQSVMDDRAKAGEIRDAETGEALLGTKAVAEELKLLIDTLGSTVTDSLEKMEEASKTVFTRVEDMTGRVDDNHSDSKAEHQQTRDQIKQAVSMVEGLQGHICEYQPKILESVKDVLHIVGQHYDFSKASTTSIQEKIEETAKDEPPMLPPPEKYDDTEVHHKLDKLVDHTLTASQALAQLETLERVHDQVRKTSEDISEFLASQRQRIDEAQEDREKTLRETTIALELRRVEKAHVEASVAHLQEREKELQEVVTDLQHDQETLMRQKIRLTADVSSLETALRLRREELREMEARAEGLERRILEGVMDHSRVLLMSKSSKGRDVMSKKRVHAQKSAKFEADPEAAPRPAVTMALAAKRTLAPASPANASRRILSLGQITSNVPTGGFKRSQSVRTAGASRAMRKSSWGGSLAKGYGELDKENEILRESDEEDSLPPAGERPIIVNSSESIADDDDDDRRSTDSAHTLRRSSRGTTIMTGGSEDERTESAYSGEEDGESDYTDGTYEDSTVGRSSTLLGADEGKEVVLFNTA